jgi:hypothetical protein
MSLTTFWQHQRLDKASRRYGPSMLERKHVALRGAVQMGVGIIGEGFLLCRLFTHQLAMLETISVTVPEIVTCLGCLEQLRIMLRGKNKLFFIAPSLRRALVLS